MSADDRQACHCGASPAEHQTRPVVCTLAAKDMPSRADAFRSVFQHLRETEPLHGGFRWMFVEQPGLQERLVALAEREHDCCPFAEFRIERDGDAIVWTVRLPPGSEALLSLFMALPEHLAGDQGLEELKVAATEAGLVFGQRPGS